MLVLLNGCINTTLSVNMKNAPAPKCAFAGWEKKEVHSLGISEIATDEMGLDSSDPAALLDFKCQEPDSTCGGGMGGEDGAGGWGQEHSRGASCSMSDFSQQSQVKKPSTGYF